MPRKPDSDKIELWLSRIGHALRVRNFADQKYGYSRSVLMYQNQYESAMPSFMRDVQLIPINEVYSFAKTFIPSVFSRNPHISLNPRGRESIGQAKMLELAVNAYWRDLRLKQEVKRTILDAILAEGWMKVGYSAANALGSIEQDEDAPKVETNEFVKDQEIFAVRVPWTAMVRDPQATNGLHDARWVAQKLVLPYAAVMDSTLYPNTSKLQPATSIDFRHHAGNHGIGQNMGQEGLGALIHGQPTSAGSEHSEEFAIIWEIWDKDTNKVYAISEGSPEFLWRPKPWPYQMEGFPFVLLRFNENPDEPYAPNLIDPWVAQLFEKIKIRAMQLDHIKRFGRQLFVEKGSISDVDMEKFSKGITGTVIEVEKGTKQPPAPIPYPALQTDVYGVERRIDMDKDNISGQPNAVRSAPQQTQSRTLGEVDRLIAAFQARQSEPQTTVEDFSGEIAYKLIALIKQFLSGEKFVRATQRDAQQIMAAFPGRFDGTGFRFSKEDIQFAEYEIEVKAGSTLPLNREGKLEALGQILRIGQALGIVPGGKVAAVVGKNILEELDIAEVTVAYEEFLAQLDAKRQVEKVKQRGMLELKQQNAASMGEQVARMEGQGGM